MSILIYILTPVLAYLIDLILNIINIFISMPFIFIQNKFDNNKSMYKFRLDMVVSGIVRGLLVVYCISILISQFEIEINFWWIISSFFLLSYLKIHAWDKSKPRAYEFSLNISPILGYIIGLFLLII